MAQPALAQAAQRVVRIAGHDIDPRLAPPAQPQRLQASGQFAGVGLTEEEIVVVELHRIDAVLALQMGEDGGGALGRFHLFAVVHRHHAAEVAAEGTADAGLVDGGAGAQERGADVARGIQPVVGIPGKFGGGTQRALGVVHVEPEGVAPGKAADARQVSAAAQRRQQFQKRILALAAHYVIHVGGV